MVPSRLRSAVVIDPLPPSCETVRQECGYPIAGALIPIPGPLLWQLEKPLARLDGEQILEGIPPPGAMLS